MLNSDFELFPSLFLIIKKVQHLSCYLCAPTCPKLSYKIDNWIVLLRASSSYNENNESNMLSNKCIQVTYHDVQKKYVRKKYGRSVFLLTDPNKYTNLRSENVYQDTAYYNPFWPNRLEVSLLEMFSMNSYDIPANNKKK